MSRTILYAEVPNFYASIERAEAPGGSDRPIIVGGNPRKRGLVQSATPDALAAGVALDMPMIEALKLCPQARVFRTDMGRYRAVSRRLFAWLRRGFHRLEPAGLCAAYFDISAAPDSPEEIAARLQRLVHRELNLPLRVGIASGKFIARLACEEAGEGGVRWIPVGEEEAFLRALPVSRLEGVGEKTAAKLAELGARSIGEIVAVGREKLEAALGTHGLRIFSFAGGNDDRPVRGTRHPQSLSRESTLGGASRDVGILAEQLDGLSQRLEAELRLQGLCAAKVALKLRFADREVTTRRQTLAEPTAAAEDIQAAAIALLERSEAGTRPVRSVGLQLGGLVLQAEVERQLELFSPRR